MGFARGKNTGDAWRVEIRDDRFAVVDTRSNRELLVCWYPWRGRLPYQRPFWRHSRVKRFTDYREALRTSRRLNAFGKSVANA